MILFFLGTMIMACFGIQGATGQTSPQQPDSSADRKAACELIISSLQKSFQEKDPTEQIVESQRTINQVLKLCKTNLAVTQILKEAISNAADVSDKQQATKLMQDALREAGATLAFKPLIEAPLPEGFLNQHLLAKSRSRSIRRIDWLERKWPELKVVRFWPFSRTSRNKTLP